MFNYLICFWLVVYVMNEKTQIFSSECCYAPLQLALFLSSKHITNYLQQIVKNYLKLTAIATKTWFLKIYINITRKYAIFS